jgi:hypothetical protein
MLPGVDVAICIALLFIGIPLLEVVVTAGAHAARVRVMLSRIINVVFLMSPLENQIIILQYKGSVNFPTERFDLCRYKPFGLYQRGIYQLGETPFRQEQYDV